MRVGAVTVRRYEINLAHKKGARITKEELAVTFTANASGPSLGLGTAGLL